MTLNTMWIDREMEADDMIQAVVGATQLALSVIRTDGGTQPRASLDLPYIAELAQVLQDGGILPSVTVFYDGAEYWLADGFHRYHAVQEVGREHIGADIRQGTRRDAVLYSVGANASHGLRRTNADKRRAVETLLNDAEWTKWSNNEIARRCATSLDLVNRMRNDSSLNESLSEPRTYITKHGTVATMNTTNIGRSSIPPDSHTEPVSPVPPASSVPPLAPYQPEVEATKEEPRWLPQGTSTVREAEVQSVPQYVPTVPRGVPAALQMSESNEWYTPAPYVNAARELMNGIDVDPASNAYANSKVVQASTYYDIETNGLDKEWRGRVWLNPPYGRDGGESNQEIWSRRLIEQHEAGITTEAVLLVNAVTDRKWFQPLWNYHICFTDHRIRFYNQETEGGQPTHGNALIYFGSQVERFVELFSAFGVIARKVVPLFKPASLWTIESEHVA